MNAYIIHPSTGKATRVEIVEVRDTVATVIAHYGGEPQTLFIPITALYSTQQTNTRASPACLNTSPNGASTR